MSNELQNHWNFGAGHISCGARGGVGVRTTYRTSVTCKRCLARLAKQDHEFQRKARRGIGALVIRGAASGIYYAPGLRARLGAPGDAASAIAREEGRAL